MSDEAPSEGQSLQISTANPLTPTLFGDLMGLLAPEKDEAPPAGSGAEAPVAPAQPGQQPAPAEGADAAGANPPAQAEGDAGKPSVEGEGASSTEPAPDKPPVPGVTIFDEAAARDVSAVQAEWGTVVENIEKQAEQVYREEAMRSLREDKGYTKYFEALAKPARALVGMEVPSLSDPSRMEVLRDSADAKDWQDSMKTMLTQEARGRAIRLSEQGQGVMRTVQASVELFQNNPDLVPQTRQFDKELAGRVVEFLTPYENRIDGKLYGYLINPQPIIDNVRKALYDERARRTTAGDAAKAAASNTAPPAGAAASAPPPPASAPQAGIPSKSASSAEPKGDYSTLFGTIGLPNLNI